MKITIACVGKIKEKYLTAGIEEFSKRLTPFCKLETLAINEERMPDNPSPAEKQQVLERETQRLLAIIPANSYVILLDVIGKQLSSPDLAAKLKNTGQKRCRRWCNGRIARCHGSIGLRSSPRRSGKLRKGPIGNQVHHEQARPGCVQR